MTDTEHRSRGSTPMAPVHAGGPAAAPARASRPAPVGSFRTIVGVGPGTRAPARLSPIGPDSVRPPAPRPVPHQPPRPMHPPIARVARPAGASPAALQAAAAAARRAPCVLADGRSVAASQGPGAATSTSGGARIGFGMPSLRRNICPHFYMTGTRGALPIQAQHLLKALVRQEANVSRCQVRGGVHLEQGFVNDVCLSARFNQCVFYEDRLPR